MEELGGAGVYSVDLWKRSMLKDESWKYDVLPEIMDGKNVADFVDPDIDSKLEELVREEALLLAEAKLRDDDTVLNEFSKTEGMLNELHSRMRQRRLENRLKKGKNHAPVSKKARKRLEEVEEREETGKAPKGLAEKLRGRSASKKK